MQEDDGHRAPSGAARTLQVLTQARPIKGRQHAALRIDALARLDHRAVQGRREQYAPREDVGAILVTDAQRIGEAGGGYQHHRLTSAREQCVGRDGGTNLDRHHCTRRGACARENRARRAQARIARRAA